MIIRLRQQQLKICDNSITQPAVYRSQFDRDKNEGVFPGNMCSERRKNHGCGKKKPEGTSASAAIFGVGTAAKCCKLKRCADRVRSRTQLEKKFRNYLNFSHSTKETVEYSFELFHSIYRFFLNCKTLNSRTIVLPFQFLKKPLFQKRRWSCDFPPRKTLVAQKHRAIFHQKKKMALSPPGRVALGHPSPSLRVCTGARAGGRVRGRTLASQPNFLGSIGYQIGHFRVVLYLFFKASLGA